MGRELTRNDHHESALATQAMWPDGLYTMAENAPSPTSTYMIWATNTPFIKIGISTDCAARLSMLQTGCPTELHFIGQFTGNYEAALANAFSLYRHRGEWFVVDGVVEAFLSSHWGFRIEPILDADIAQQKAIPR